LREIADETIELDELSDNVIRSMQKHVEIDEPEEEDPIELMAGAAMAGDAEGFESGPSVEAPDDSDDEAE